MATVAVKRAPSHQPRKVLLVGFFERFDTELIARTTTRPHYSPPIETDFVVEDVMVHRLAAMVSIVKAVETGHLTAAMSYGPIPAAAWFVFCAVNAIRRPLRRARPATSPASGEVRPI